MKRVLYTAAFAVAIATAPFALAQSSRNSETTTPSTSAQHAPPVPPMSRMSPMSWMRGGGMSPMAGEGPWWHRRGWGRHMMGWQNSKEACIHRIAHRAAMLAYIGTELDLTAQQQPLWQKLANTGSEEARKELDLCNELGEDGAATVLDRLTLAHRLLSARLAGLDAAIPEVKALYETLTPEQKAILDRPWGSD